MASVTLSGYSSLGYAITDATQNTVTIDQTGTIVVAGSTASAIYGQFGIRGTVVNLGSLSAPASIAVWMTSGGYVVNGSAVDTTASISGGLSGIRIGERGIGTVVNFGTIVSAGVSGSTIGTSGFGVSFDGSGTLINGSASDTLASIAGQNNGVRAIGTAVSVLNFGTINGYGAGAYGVYLRAGGVVTNGSAADTAALINGYYVGIQSTTKSGTITNYGTIQSFSQAPTFGRAIMLSAGGTVVNGSAVDHSALLQGALMGVYIKGGSNNGPAGFSASKVYNFGTINGFSGAGVYIRLGQNPLVVNGSATDTTALIESGGMGIRVQNFAAATVTNFGTVIAGNGAGVNLASSGVVTNGSATDTTALIQSSGQSGVILGGYQPSTLVNYGTIALAAGDGARNVVMYGSGTIVNGSTTDRRASITGGAAGASVLAGTGTVINEGTITGTVGVSFYKTSNHATLTATGTVMNSGLIASTLGAQGIAVQFGAGDERLLLDTGASFVGRVLGGSGTNTLELANASSGDLYGFGNVITNFGTLVVDAGAYWRLTGTSTLAAGLNIQNNGTVVDAGTLLVTGGLSFGLIVAAGATLINAGSIGLDGPGASFANGGRLTIMPGATFSYGAAGAGNTALELASGGAGVLTGLGSRYVGFNAVTVDRNANWTLSGSDTIGSGTGLTNYGTLTVAGMLLNAGSIGGTVTVASGATLINQGTLGGSGATNGTATTLAAGGTLVLDPGSTVIGQAVGGSGGSTLELAGGGAGSLAGLGGNGWRNFTSILVDAGANWTLGGSSTIASGGTLTNAGSLTLAGTLFDSGVVAGPLTVAAGGTLEVFGTVGSGLTLVGASRLVLGPNAVLQGPVSGGGAATLELAAGGSGVLTGLGGSLGNFAATVVDPGALWALNGVNTLAAGDSLTIYGTLIDAGNLINRGAITGTVTVASGGTLLNSGTLGGNGTALGFGATLASGGTLVVAPGATLIGKAVASTAGGTLELAAGGGGTLTGLGTTYFNFTSVAVDAGATWTLAGSNAVAANMTLSNAGSLYNAGVLTDAGTILGPITVQKYGTLSVSGTLGSDGVTNHVNGSGRLIVKSGAVLGGTIVGVGGATLELANGGAGTLSGLGARISGFGSTVIDPGGNWTLMGANSVAAGTVLTNSGWLTDAGTLLNAGSIAGTVTVAGGATLINQGTLGGNGTATGVAATLATGGRLVLTPGAVLVGKALGGAAGSILELAAGGAATLTGLGTSLTNFSSIIVDASAQWTLASGSTIAAGTSLIDAGTLSATGVLLNRGTIGGALTLAGGATVTNYGTIGSAVFAAGGLLQVGAGSRFLGTVAGGGAGAMELLGASAGTLSGLDGSNAGLMSSGGGSWSFSGMSKLIVDRGANWALGGTNTLGTAGGVTIAGTLAATGPLVLGGNGPVSINNGTAKLLATNGLSLRGATLAPVASGMVEVGAAGSLVGNTVVIDAGQTLSGYGTIASAVVDNGTLLAQGGTLAVTGRVSGSGGVTLASGATLIERAGLVQSSLVFATGGNETLQMASGTSIGATISGFGGGDTIDFLNTVATSLSFAGGRLKVIGGGTTIASLGFAGTYTTANFALSSDGHGGTNLTTVGLPMMAAPSAGLAASPQQAAPVGGGLTSGSYAAPIGSAVPGLSAWLHPNQP